MILVHYNLCKDMFMYLFLKVVVSMPVKNNIQKIRKERGIKQIRMAEDLEVTRQTFTAIEKNKYNPSLELALKILHYFELPLEEVFTLEEEEEK